MFITNRAGTKLTVNIRDERDLANDPIIGKWESTLDQFLANSKQKIDWFNLNDAQSGRINLTCLWKPVLIDNIPGPGGFGNIYILFYEISITNFTKTKIFLSS
jgi:Ca2+-dependent lipid-binding protein